jgi:hypothetical protein
VEDLLLQEGVQKHALRVPPFANLEEPVEVLVARRQLVALVKELSPMWARAVNLDPSPLELTEEIPPVQGTPQ